MSTPHLGARLRGACSPFSSTLLVVLAVVAGGCNGQSAQRGREYTPDMTYSVAYDSFAPNRATRNGMTLQTPVRGTIPRGFLPLHYTNTEAEAERAGRELSNPFAHVPSAVEQGHRQYETFCLVCHGARGDGDGPIVPLIPNPPAYSSERVRAMPAGQLFHVITYGSGRMPSYASQVPASDRWLIVTYVQTLQTRQEARQPDILGRRALPSGRLASLGATPGLSPRAAKP